MPCVRNETELARAPAYQNTSATHTLDAVLNALQIPIATDPRPVLTTSVEILAREYVVSTPNAQFITMLQIVSVSMDTLEMHHDLVTPLKFSQLQHPITHAIHRHVGPIVSAASKMAMLFARANQISSVRRPIAGLSVLSVRSVPRTVLVFNKSAQILAQEHAELTPTARSSTTIQFAVVELDTQGTRSSSATLSTMIHHQRRMLEIPAFPPHADLTHSVV